MCRSFDFYRPQQTDHAATYGLAHVHMNVPALASARRPGSSCAFHSGQAWIICGQISSVTATSAAPAMAAKRVASASSVSVIAIHSGGEVGIGQFGEIVLVNERINGVLTGEGRAGHRHVGPRRYEPRATRRLFVTVTQM
jgi:hypothetical protein